MKRISYCAGIVAAFLATTPVRSPVLAATYYWADREGFHSVDRVARVPLEHRKDLPAARNGTALPFTEEEDRDGAMYVWITLGQSGCDYPYTAAANFPGSPSFIRVTTPRDGDVAWLENAMAIYREQERSLQTAAGGAPLTALEKDQARIAWYRCNAPPSPRSKSGRRAPQKSLKAADRELAPLAGASFSPPRVRDDAELARLKKGWQRAVNNLESLRRNYSDDPLVLRRLGDCYRMGRNLGVPGSRERAEAYLLQAEALDPGDAEAYISLGAHYADTGIENGPLAEAQFRRALTNAPRERLPQVWWGLAVSLYYQGKTAEAVTAIDSLIAIRPDDAAAKKLRDSLTGGEAPKGGK